MYRENGQGVGGWGGGVGGVEEMSRKGTISPPGTASQSAANVVPISCLLTKGRIKTNSHTIIRGEEGGGGERGGEIWVKD